MRAFSIHIYDNAEEHKKKVEGLCIQNGVKIGPLFQAIIENMTDEEWNKYAELAKTKKDAGKTVRKQLSKTISQLDDKGVEALMKSLKEQGIKLQAE